MNNIIELVKNKNDGKRCFTLMDFPDKGINTGNYNSSSPQKAAEKIFNKLVKKMNFYDNLGGTKYLLFHIQDINNKKIYPYVGTVVILKNPVDINYSNKNIKVTHRNIVEKFDNNIKETFKNNLP